MVPVFWRDTTFFWQHHKPSSRRGEPLSTTKMFWPPQVITLGISLNLVRINVIRISKSLVEMPNEFLMEDSHFTGPVIREEGPQRESFVMYMCTSCRVIWARFSYPCTLFAVLANAFAASLVFSRISHMALNLRVNTLAPSV